MQKKGRRTTAKKSAPRKRRPRKAKVALDGKKLMLLCAVVCASCVLLLAVTAFLSKGESAKTTAQKPPVEKVQEPSVSKVQEPPVQPAPLAQKEPEVEKPETPKKEEKPKIESPKIQEQEKVNDRPKAEEPVAKSFDFPYAQKNAVLSIVFDDGGQNISQLRKCVALPFPVTVAVLPRLAHSAQAAQIVRQSGNEVILHQPMQAINLNVNPGEGAIKPEMSAGEVQATLAMNIAEIAPIAGMNNHEGSLITEDEVMMAFVLQTAHEKGLYFLDSRTSSATKVPSVCMQMGYGYYQRDIFLDNKKTRENYLSELKKGLDVANKKGHVIMIGHVWSAETLPAFLEEVYPELALKGYRFATVSKSGGIIQ